ncbi:MAG: HAD family hydrolase [bacterium]
MSNFCKENIKGVFFDLYGTLLIFNNIEQSWEDWIIKFHELIKDKSEISFEDFSLHCDSFMKRDVVKDVAMGLTTYETRIRDLCRGINLELGIEELKKISDETPRAWQGFISPAKDVYEILAELKTQKILALITNFDHAPHIRYTLNEFKLGDFFDVILISDEVETKKPEPKIFRMALDKTGLKPNEVIFVGDSEDDVNGALASNIQPVLIMHDTFTTMHDYKHDYDDFEDFRHNDNAIIIHSLTELVKLIV